MVLTTESLVADLPEKAANPSVKKQCFLTASKRPPDIRRALRNSGFGYFA